MRIHRMLHVALVTVTLVAGWAWPSFAQTITRTNLDAAIDATQITFTVGSGTDIDARDLMFVDDEAMRVVRRSGAVVTVQRGTDGTLSASHAASAIVHHGPGDAFPLTWRNLASADTRATGKVRETVTTTTLTTAGALTYTAAQILGGLILRDPAGAARTDTLPTATLLIAALPRAKVGDWFEFTVRNTADAAETITVASGTGGTDSGTMTIAQNNTKRFGVRITGSTTYDVFSLGTVIH